MFLSVPILHPHNTFNMSPSPTFHPYLLFCRGNTHWFVQIRVRFVFVLCKNLCWFCCCCCQEYFNGSALMVHSSSGSVTRLVSRDFSFLDLVDFLIFFILYFVKNQCNCESLMVPVTGLVRISPQGAGRWIETLIQAPISNRCRCKNRFPELTPQISFLDILRLHSQRNIFWNDSLWNSNFLLVLQIVGEE